MSNTALLGSYGGQGNSSLMFRNHLINGCFRVWQRGTSQTSNGYGSDDRWINGNVGSTKTHSQQTFTLGQTDVPGNPSFFSRTVVSSVAGANNYTVKFQRIEGVRTLAGQTATLSFWAKADAAKNMAVEFVQSFGSGGSPSADIGGIGVTTIALTTSWKYYTVTVTLPSISGKTLGTNNDDYVQMLFWFEAGSTYNSRTNSLGQQSGTFDIAMVQLEAETATPFERRPFGMELALCQRYGFDAIGASKGGNYSRVGTGGMNRTSTSSNITVVPPVTLRVRPNSLTQFGSTGLVYNGTSTAIISAYSLDVPASTNQLITIVVTHSSGPTLGSFVFIESSNTQSNSMFIDAEL